MLEGVDFTVSYVSVLGIISLCKLITIDSAEGLILYLLDIYSAFQNIIITDPQERVFPSLPHLYLESVNRKYPNHPLSSRNFKNFTFNPSNQLRKKKPDRNPGMIH